MCKRIMRAVLGMWQSVSAGGAGTSLLCGHKAANQGWSIHRLCFNELDE